MRSIRSSLNGPIGAGFRVAVILAAMVWLALALERRAANTPSDAARALLEEKRRDFDGATPRSDAELEAFVGRCETAADAELHPAARVRLLTSALWACNENGTYAAARRLRTRLFRKLFRAADRTIAGRSDVFLGAFFCSGRSGVDGAAQCAELAAVLRSAVVGRSSKERALAAFATCCVYNRGAQPGRAALGPAEIADWERALTEMERMVGDLPESMRRLRYPAAQREAYERFTTGAGAASR